MKRGNLVRWASVEKCNNLLFFSQLVNELLFDYSIPSNRISTLNSHYLCLDALSAIEGIDEHGVPEGTLKPIMEEFLSVLEKDPVLSGDENPKNFFVKYQNEKYVICNRVADIGYGELKSIAISINNYFFNENKYYLQLSKRIKEIIVGNNANEQQILFRLTKSLLTELMNAGYSLRYLYMTMNSLFWSPTRPITSSKAIDDFFNAFDFTTKEYSVLFKVRKTRMGKLTTFIEDLNCIDELPEDIRKRVNKSFLHTKNDEAFIILQRKCLDPYGAAESAIKLFELNSAVYRLYDHRYRYNIAGSDYVVLDTDSEYKKGRSIKAVEHTKKPASKTIAESMGLVNNAIQNIAKTGSYDDALSILNAIKYHSHSLDSYSEENQLLDLWAIFESVLDISNKHTSDRIQQICKYLVPMLKQKYLYSLFKQLSDDIKSYREDIYNDIIAGASTEKEIVNKVCEFVLLDSFAEKREYVLSLCDDFPLLKERVAYFGESLKTPAQVHAFVEKHAERVKWQIMRIYRNRNLIIHNGKSMPYLSLLIENLHSYVDDFLTYAIHSFYQKKDVETMCQELFAKECRWNSMLPRQKTPITEEQIRYLLSM